MKILLAEDDVVSREILEVHLARWGYQVISVPDGEEAWRILQSDAAPRLVILNGKMPVMDGLEVCRKVRSEAQEFYTYLILLTTLSGEEDFVTGMSAGADDYLSKPYHLNELQVRLRAGRRIVDLQEMQKKLIVAQETLRAKASHDSLTRLWNHEEILAILEHELLRGEREGNLVSIIMADLDMFKQINDRYGHLAGDAVLRETANRFSSLLRPYDAVGRYGGEEFLFVLPGCDQKKVAAIAERIRSSIGDVRMDSPKGMIPVTVSLGTALSVPGGSDVSTLVQTADRALYRAKRKGRNRVEVDLGPQRRPPCEYRGLQEMGT